MTLKPNWLTCEHPDGCEGIRWGGSDLCLAHLSSSEQADALGLLQPGSDVDLRGTRITTRLLVKVLKALTPETSADAAPTFGTARFELAQFVGGVRLEDARFTKDAWFDGAQFNQSATFENARFTRTARFPEAQFKENVRFVGAQFAAAARFDETRFNREARFDKVQFNGTANFYKAQFGWHARFNGAQFKGRTHFNQAKFTWLAQFRGSKFNEAVKFDKAIFDDEAWFTAAKFERVAQFVGVQFAGNALFGSTQFRADVRFDQSHFGGSWSGPMVCLGMLSTRQAEFDRSLRLQIAAQEIILVGARFTEPCVFEVRYAAVNLADVAGSAPITIAYHPRPLAVPGRSTVLDEQDLTGKPQASVVSLVGADAAIVVLNDVDLSRCVFSGAHHLDKIRLEGQPQFAEAPRGLHWGRALVPVRFWTRRKVLAEEAAWRVDAQLGPELNRAGWAQSTPASSPKSAAAPVQLAALYRQLRKALEDGKDTPGAADFYFGEMEARRHDKEGTPRSVRVLLHVYWFLCGYALRASRALLFLTVAAATTFLLMLTIGLPNNQLDPQISGTIPASGGHLTLTQSTPNPILTLPFGQRFAVARADQAGLVVVNAVIFRSTDATLTEPGTWFDIISRIGEPVLLGFAAVAARGRVQR